MPDKPTVQAELLAACKTLVECVQEYRKAGIAMACAETIARLKKTRANLDAAIHLGRAAIHRAESEAKNGS